MNAFAADRAKHSAIPWICINCDDSLIEAIQRSALSTDQELARQDTVEQCPLERLQKSPKIVAAEGMAVLERIINHYHGGPIIVSHTDLAARVRSSVRHAFEATNLVLTTECTYPAHAERVEEASRIGLQTTYVAPRNAVEQAIVEIWERLLGVAPIGVEDNFFDLNGHSLLAVRLMGEIKKALGRQLPLPDSLWIGYRHQL